MLMGLLISYFLVLLIIFIRNLTNLDNESVASIAFMEISFLVVCIILGNNVRDYNLCNELFTGYVSKKFLLIV